MEQVPLTAEDLQALETRLLGKLRVELMSIHLGDDMTLTETEAARLLGIHPKTLSKMRLAGEIPAGYLGISPRYALGQIRALMRRMAEGESLETGQS